MADLMVVPIVAVGVMVCGLIAKLHATRARAEASARRAEASEHRFAATFHHSPQPLTLMHLASNRYTEVNPAFVALVARSREELLAATVTELAIFPEQERVTNRLQESGAVRDDATQVRRPDGTLRDVMLAMDIIIIDGVPHSLTTLIDVTEQRRTEAALRASEAQVRQKQKMESLGMLAGGIAHDFNNMLAVIGTDASMLAPLVGTNNEQRELVDEIDLTVSRAADLTRQLLAFSRKQVAAPVVLDLNETVRDTHKLLRRMIGEDVRLVTSYEPDLAHVRVDPGHIGQVLMNLAINARDAMPRGGTLTIETRCVAEGVVLSISDTGVGMPAEICARIFEPFFTTKGIGKGTGMGLSVVHGIVQQANGRITVESQPGVGTTFRVHLPAVHESDTLDDIPVFDLGSGTETILVVDDDDHVRKVATRALTSRGYKVVQVGNGHAALRALDRASIDLLLTDVVMPSMDGRELVEMATAAHPKLKVLYMSGYTDDAVVRHGVLRGEAELIEKPFRVASLAAKVRQVLDHAA